MKGNLGPLRNHCLGLGFGFGSVNSVEGVRILQGFNQADGSRSQSPNRGFEKTYKIELTLTSHAATPVCPWSAIVTCTYYCGAKCALLSSLHARVSLPKWPRNQDLSCVMTSIELGQSWVNKPKIQLRNS